MKTLPKIKKEIMPRIHFCTISDLVETIEWIIDVDEFDSKPTYILNKETLNWNEFVDLFYSAYGSKKPIRLTEKQFRRIWALLYLFDKIFSRRREIFPKERLLDIITREWLPNDKNARILWRNGSIMKDINDALK